MLHRAFVMVVLTQLGALHDVTHLPARWLCPPEMRAVFAQEAPQRGTDIHASNSQLTEPIARVLQSRMHAVEYCRMLFSRVPTAKDGAVNLQVWLGTFGNVTRTCVLDDGTMDAPTVGCTLDVLDGVVFPPGAFPTRFRWRVRYQVQ